MAIAVVSTGQANTDAAGSTSLDIPLSVPDANSVILLGVGCDNTVNFNPAPLWDSSAASSVFTLITERFSTGRYISAFYLLNPSTGTHAVTVNGLSSAAGIIHRGAAVAYSGVDSTTPYDTATVSADSVGGTSSGVQSSAVPSESGDVVVSFVCVNNTAATALVIGGGGTARVISTAGSNLAFAVAEWAGAATVASTWSWPSSNLDHGVITFNVNASGGAASPSLRPSRRMLGMVGR